MLDLALGFIGGLASDLARGMTLARLRGKAEQLANPPDQQAASDNDFLRGIYHELKQANNLTQQSGPGAYPVEFTDTLFRGEGLEHRINRQGRKHMSIMPVNTGVILAIISPAGRVTYALNPGVYTQIDAPQGTTYRLDTTSPNATETVTVRLWN